MKKIIDQIDKAKRILITGHVNPDGDCVGAGLGLMLALNKYNSDGEKIIRFSLEDIPPSTTRFLDHFPLIEKTAHIDTKYEFDTVIAVDSADISRIGNEITRFIRESTVIVNIDHHISNTNYGAINYVKSETSSTSEIIYELINELGVAVDSDIAECIYMGIINDTGNLSYSNVSIRTISILAELKEYGLDNEKVVREFYLKKSFARLKLLGEALANFEFNEEKKLCYYYLTKETIEKHGGIKGNTEGIVENLRSYDQAEVALFMREEHNGEIKGSFRSNEIDVNEIAAVFGGGGHKKASGFSTKLSKDEILTIVLGKL